MQKSNQKTVLKIATLVVMWGLAWSAIKIGLTDAPPVLYAAIRTLLGGLVLLPVAMRNTSAFAFRQKWRIYLIASAFNVALFFGLQTIALYFLPSGLLAVLVYLQPILVGLFAPIWLGETMSVGKAIGLVLGFLGVASISIESLTGHTSLTGIVLGVVAAVSWALGTVYLKKVQGHVDLIWLVTVQFILGGLALTGVGSVMEHWSSIHWTLLLAASEGYTSVIGVSLSWILWLDLMRAGEISRLSAWIFFVPLLSVAVGVLFLHEAFTSSLVVGLVLDVFGIYLVNRTPSKPQTLRKRERSESNLSG